MTTKRPKMLLQKTPELLWHAIDKETQKVIPELQLFCTKRLLQGAIQKKYPLQRFSHDSAEAEMRLKTILNNGRDFYLTSEEIFQKYMNLRKWFKLNAYEWGVLEGYRRAVNDRWHRENLVYCVRWQGQIIINKWDNLPEEAREFLRKATYDEAFKITGMYWKHHETKQPYKLFY